MKRLSLCLILALIVTSLPFTTTAQGPSDPVVDLSKPGSGPNGSAPRSAPEPPTTPGQPTANPPVDLSKNVPQAEGPTQQSDDAAAGIQPPGRRGRRPVEDRARAASRRAGTPRDRRP